MLDLRHLRLGLLPLLAVLAGCSSFVEGNGVYAERVLEAGPALPEFHGVSIGFPGDVDVSGHPLVATVYAAAEARRVVLSGDENVIEHIKVSVDAGGRLVTTIDVDGYSSVHPPQLLVHAPSLAAVESLGGADVAVHGAPAVDFGVIASSRGHVTLAGPGGGDLTAALSGGAQLDASAYPVRSAVLTLAEASCAKVWPEQPVTGAAADGSTVLVKGSAGCEVALSGGSTCGPLP
jgi:hypothetical protein